MVFIVETIVTGKSSFLVFYFLSKILSIKINNIDMESGLKGCE